MIFCDALRLVCRIMECVASNISRYAFRFKITKSRKVGGYTALFFIDGNIDIRSGGCHGSPYSEPIKVNMSPTRSCLVTHHIMKIDILSDALLNDSILLHNAILYFPCSS